MDLTPADIQYAISEIDFDESFYFELKDDRVSPKKMMEEVLLFQIHLAAIFSLAFLMTNRLKVAPNGTSREFIQQFMTL